jgi:Fe-S-cluster containining protein
VGFEKGQQNFGEGLEGSEKVAGIAASPITTGLPVDPQITHAEGPKFDFSATAVTKSETALRKAVTELKAMLEDFAGACSGKAGYASLAAQLDRHMPELYRHYDGFVQAVLATGEERISCSKGCSHCCSHYVTSVEPYELLFLHGRIREDARYPGRIIALHRRVSLFKSLLKGAVHDDAMAEEEDKALYRYYLRGQPCPFLQAGGVCGVYENRPMSCRMFYSLSHPSLCKGKNVIDPGNRNFLIELPEDIEADLARAGAMFARFDLPESLFEGLLEVNERFGRFDVPG